MAKEDKKYQVRVENTTGFEQGSEPGTILVTERMIEKETPMNVKGPIIFSPPKFKVIKRRPGGPEIGAKCFRISFSKNTLKDCVIGHIVDGKCIEYDVEDIDVYEFFERVLDN